MRARTGRALRVQSRQRARHDITSKAPAPRPPDWMVYGLGLLDLLIRPVAQPWLQRCIVRREPENLRQKVR